MDQFYLNNAALYQTLVKGLKQKGILQQVEVATESTSPDMVVTARIRPLLSEEKAGNYPCAVFPRPAKSGVVDIHDLYSPPRGRPVLKVYRTQSICRISQANHRCF